MTQGTVRLVLPDGLAPCEQVFPVVRYCNDDVDLWLDADGSEPSSPTDQQACVKVTDDDFEAVEVVVHFQRFVTDLLARLQPSWRVRFVLESNALAFI